MTNQQYQERLYEATLRIEKCIPLFGCVHAGDAPSPDFDDFLDDTSPEDLVRLWPGIENYVADIDKANNAELLEAFSSIQETGYLVQVATPVMRPSSPTSSSYSWGRYHTHWLYANSMDTIIEEAEAWAEGWRKVELEDAGIVVAKSS